MIPKILHQIWSDVNEPLPDFFIQLSRTWKNSHPEWKYEFWDDNRMASFINTCEPYLADTYNNFKYDVQRWDFIRYLILYKTGGMYVDFDYECLESFDHYLVENKCYFAMEPEEHRIRFRQNIYFSNALMA